MEEKEPMEELEEENKRLIRKINSLIIVSFLLSIFFSISFFIAIGTDENLLITIPTVLLFILAVFLIVIFITDKKKKKINKHLKLIKEANHNKEKDLEFRKKMNTLETQKRYMEAFEIYLEKGLMDDCHRICDEVIIESQKTGNYTQAVDLCSRCGLNDKADQILKKMLMNSFVDERTVNMDSRISENVVLPEDIKLDNYSIIRKLGSGGFSNVYLAKDNFKNEVALKIAKETMDEDSKSKITNQFRSEALNWKNLFYHEKIKDGVVAIIDFGTGNRPYIAMEYMSRGNLRYWMNEMNFKQKKLCIISVLNTLSLVHHLGVVHRDIKPENILLDKEENWKIADWGLSKVLMSSERSTTQDGMIKATLSYAAPEQIDSSKFGKVDWRTDIHQVGIMAYELLTGKKPYTGDPVELVFSIMNDKPIHPSELNSEVSRPVGDAIMKAIEKRKTDRWTDSNDFARVLKNSLR